VTVGERVGSLWVIKGGLKPGERVAADGAQFLREGTLVRTKPFTPATVSE
jgi:membrane fusion protein, multidrug efflux system